MKSLSSSKPRLLHNPSLSLVGRMEALNCVFKTQLLPSGGVMNIVLSRIHPISDLLCFSAQRPDDGWSDSEYSLRSQILWRWFCGLYHGLKLHLRTNEPYVEVQACSIPVATKSNHAKSGRIWDPIARIPRLPRKLYQDYALKPGRKLLSSKVKFYRPYLLKSTHCFDRSTLMAILMSSNEMVRLD